MDRLIEGYRRFRAHVWTAQRERYRALAERGQRPETLVVACSDSRVDPATVFDAAPGEMFAVRNVAGLVPQYQPDANYHGTSAALEYGVRVLGVSRVVVLGHAQCGGVRAMVDGAPEEARDFVAPWVNMAEPALRRARAAASGDALAPRCEIEVLRLSLENLASFPWIAAGVAEGRLTLEAYRFDIHTGVLEQLTDTGVVKIA